MRRLFGPQSDFSKATLIHPILLGCYPALALYAQNTGQVAFNALPETLLVLAVFAIVVFLLSTLCFASWQKGALVTSTILLLFFSYGHVYSVLKHVFVGGILIGRHRYLIPLWILVMALVVWLVGFRSRGLMPTNRVVAAFSLALVAIPGVSITSYEVRVLWDSRGSAAAQTQDGLIRSIQSTDELPDIYYIITDAYARWDVLRDSFGYDNSAFDQFLTAHGFYVAHESNANYLWTHLSLSSSLNMNYIQELIPQSSTGTPPAFGELLQDSLVRSTLEAAGYQTVGFATGWVGTEWKDADFFFAPDMTGLEGLSARGFVSPFEGMLVSNSVLKVLLDIDSLRHTPLARYFETRLQFPFTVQREIILAVFENLKAVPPTNRPKFVFAHIIAPHGPFIFGPNGEEIRYARAFTLADDPDMVGDLGRDRYVDELIYVTRRLEETVDYIQTHSTRPVVIILQSDHGASPTLQWTSPTVRGVTDKMGILNAYLVPDECKDLLYPSVSPVNSFRIVLSCTVGTPLSLLEDKTYVGYNDFIDSEEYFSTLPPGMGGIK